MRTEADMAPAAAAEASGGAGPTRTLCGGEAAEGWAAALALGSHAAPLKAASRAAAPALGRARAPAFASRALDSVAGLRAAPPAAAARAEPAPRRPSIPAKSPASSGRRLAVLSLAGRIQRAIVRIAALTACRASCAIGPGQRSRAASGRRQMWYIGAPIARTSASATSATVALAST